MKDLFIEIVNADRISRILNNLTDGNISFDIIESNIEKNKCLLKVNENDIELIKEIISDKALLIY